jgi:hypothetical protein
MAGPGFSQRIQAEVISVLARYREKLVLSSSPLNFQILPTGSLWGLAGCGSQCGLALVCHALQKPDLERGS